MPAERVPMRRVREIVRLSFSSSLSAREIARQTGVPESTVRAAIKRFQATGLTWPLPEGMTDAGLEATLYGGAATRRGRRSRAEPPSIASSNASMSRS